MAAPTVLVDCNYLSYRAFYSKAGMLSHGGQATGVVYGFMRAVRDFEARWPLCRLAFCWDYGRGLREQKHPWYKESRRKKRKEEMKDKKKRKMWRDFQQQVDDLRDKHLKRVGYRNVFKADGYEADDVIARLVEQCQEEDPDRKVVIVSGDEDLYQLLRRGVSCFHPKDQTTVTQKGFTNSYGIPPCLWAKVKAIAGCKGDDVPGVRGIGEKKASLFVSGNDGLPAADRKKINAFLGSDEYKRNLRLVKLPYKDCPSFEFRKDKVNINGWNELMAEIGANSLKQSTTPWGGAEAIF